MERSRAKPTSLLSSRLSRREALQSYAPPAVALVVVGAVHGMGTSGKVPVTQPNSGGHNRGGGNGPKNPAGKK